MKRKLAILFLLNSLIVPIIWTNNVIKNIDDNKEKHFLETKNIEITNLILQSSLEDKQKKQLYCWAKINTETHQEGDFIFKFSLKDILAKRFLGDLTNNIDKIKNTKINLYGTDEHIFKWYDNGVSVPTWGFLYVLENKKLVKSYLSDYLSQYWYFWNGWTGQSYYGKDEAKIKFNNYYRFDFNTWDFIVKHQVRVDAIDYWYSGAPDTYSHFYVTNLDTLDISGSIKLPYSRYDVENFKKLFSSTFEKPIRLTNATSPIIFNYTDNPNDPNKWNENERYIRKEIEKRINEFYSNEQILNKLGKVTQNGRSTGVTDIEVIIPESIRGKAGSQTNIEIELRLKNGEFYFDEHEATNKINTKFNIYVELNPEIDYEINELIQITPYNSASNEIKDNWILDKELKFKLGENDPNPYRIKAFNKNINKPVYGDYPIIPVEKFPSIGRYGMILDFDIKLTIDETKEIKKTLRFNRLFNNGKTFATLLFSRSDFDNIWIKNLKIDFGLEMIKDQINMFNSQPIELETSLNNEQMKNKKVSIDIEKVSYTLPKEQYVSKSTWVQEMDAIYSDKNSNKPNFMGTWRTYDPFYFKMFAQYIPVYDPITGVQLGYASKYKPFIRKGQYSPKVTYDSNSESKEDAPIFPEPGTETNQANFFADFGSYFMQNKTEKGVVEFQIVIKEYNHDLQDYTQDRWIINVAMELLVDQAKFVMSGYSGNELIDKENEEVYFNEKHEKYRGDFVNRDSGMYIPKIVWVNSYPPESFLYDPLDENGKEISKHESADKDNLRYDIGYIAQLNATGFGNGDYSSNPTFGGYETIFKTDVFSPSGLIPYSEFYTFNSNSLIPKIERVPLSKSGLQTIKSSDNFRQIVLKRPTSNMYLYQFVKISEKSEIEKFRGDLIGLYGKHMGLKNKPLFVDFWDTYHGKNLTNYLVYEHKLVESEEKLRELEYYDVIQYWNIYVNSPELNGNASNSGGNQDKNTFYNIKDLILDRQVVSSNELEILRKKVIDQIQTELNKKVKEKGWIGENKLLNDVHFKIEENQAFFENKLRILLKQYDLPLNEIESVAFNIIINDEAFNNQLIKINGQNTIFVLNNKDANKIIDLANYNGGKLQINTTKEPFLSSNNIINEIKKVILNAIDLDWIKIINNSEIEFESNFIPKLGINYELKFYTKIYKQNQLVDYYYSTIEQAIKDVLLYQVDQPFFDNNLYVKIIAKENKQTNFMKNSFTKLVNNNVNNPSINFIDPFDLNKIKAKDLKINTKSKYFPEQDFEKQPIFIFNLIKERIQKDIEFWSRKWSNINNESIVNGIDYQIKFIKSINNEETIYYENELEAIKEVLLLNLDESFNRDLLVEVVAINKDNNYKTSGKFIKKINNSYLNKEIEEDKYDDVELDEIGNVDNSIDPDITKPTEEDKKIDISNKTPNKEKINLWWVITPTTILFIIITSAAIVFVIRKNRKIR